MRIDVHQHIWTEALYGVLARRQAPPRIRAHAWSWSLELPGEAPFPLPPVPDAPDRRVAELEAAGVDVAVVALSTALGVETLPAEQALAILDAWDDDADSFPPRLPAWGSVALAEPDPGDVDRALQRGRVGLTLPATALSTPDGLDRVGPLLERLQARDSPLFVHPGPPPAGAWLPFMTSYLASLSDAWHAWMLHGRRRHPELRVVFAALAGLAPLHAERLGTRHSRAAAQAALADGRTYYDTSTYGPVAVEAMVRAVGSQALVNGSDRPYARPGSLPLAHRSAILERNPRALLGLARAVTARRRRRCRPRATSWSPNCARWPDGSAPGSICGAPTSATILSGATSTDWSTTPM